MKLTKPNVIFFFLVWVGSLQAQYQPSPENLKNRAQFQDDKFGLFIHWGPYSLLGSGEWILHNRGMKLSDYQRLATFFNPVRYDPAKWVAMAKGAGMKYITITSRHHDGFAMFQTRASNWNIMEASPFRRDVLKELAEACRKEGIKLFFYYSHLDWYHPDYFPRGNTGKLTGRPESGDWNRYLAYMNQQLTELLTQYGDVAGIWFDGWWDKKETADWKLSEQYALIHKLQPGCLIGNNHHQPVKDGEDFQMFEKDLPGQNSTGFSAESKVGALPLEMCETMYGKLGSRESYWGFQIDSKTFKSSRDIITLLVKSAGYNSNFLLNVGPDPMGEIQSEFVDTLKKVGEWTRRYGDSFYGTRGGPVGPHDWGVTTQKGNRVFVHLLAAADRKLWIPSGSRKIQKLVEFGSNRPVPFTQLKDGILVELPEKGPEGSHRILEWVW